MDVYTGDNGHHLYAIKNDNDGVLTIGVGGRPGHVNVTVPLAEVPSLLKTLLLESGASSALRELEAVSTVKFSDQALRPLRGMLMDGKVLDRGSVEFYANELAEAGWAPPWDEA